VFSSVMDGVCPLSGVFMAKYPDQAHELAKEVAAFGSSNTGIIFLGVSDNTEIVGLHDVETVKDRGRLQTRVEGVCANSVSPSLVARTTFEEYDGKRVLRIEVPKGSEPVYYSTDRPYVRHGSLSRPARPQEVTELVRRWLARQSG
jgi:ATP-dependent DNA helicase RecG